MYLSAETTNEMNEWISQIRSVMTAVRSGGGGTRVANPIKSPQTTQPTTPVKKRPAPAKPIDAIAATVSYSVANNTLISSTTTSTTTATGVNSYTFLSFFFFFLSFHPKLARTRPTKRRRPTVLKCKQKPRQPLTRCAPATTVRRCVYTVHATTAFTKRKEKKKTKLS